MPETKEKNGNKKGTDDSRRETTTFAEIVIKGVTVTSTVCFATFLAWKEMNGIVEKGIGGALVGTVVVGISVGIAYTIASWACDRLIEKFASNENRTEKRKPAFISLTEEKAEE